MTAAQAVECLGRAVHVGVARRLVLRLAAEGVLSTGLTYGSAFSGIDTFAAGVDQVFGEDWRYAFASEASAVARRGLCAAWGSRALTEGMVWQDARGEAASAVSYVDLYVTTPNCETYSRRNHGPSAKMQHTSLRDVWRSLEYVRRQRPKVVIVENVAEPTVVGPLTGLLGRLEGYTLRTSMLDPRAVAGAPVARERQFWVLVRH